MKMRVASRLARAVEQLGDRLLASRDRRAAGAPARCRRARPRRAGWPRRARSAPGAARRPRSTPRARARRGRGWRCRAALRPAAISARIAARGFGQRAPGEARGDVVARPPRAPRRWRRAAGRAPGSRPRRPRPPAPPARASRRAATSVSCASRGSRRGTMTMPAAPEMSDRIALVASSAASIGPGCGEPLLDRLRAPARVGSATCIIPSTNRRRPLSVGIRPRWCAARRAGRALRARPAPSGSRPATG